jgi:hypothetical protein
MKRTTTEVAFDFRSVVDGSRTHRKPPGKRITAASKRISQEG